MQSHCLLVLLLTLILNSHNVGDWSYCMGMLTPQSSEFSVQLMVLFWLTLCCETNKAYFHTDKKCQGNYGWNTISTLNVREWNFCCARCSFNCGQVSIISHEHVDMVGTLHRLGLHGAMNSITAKNSGQFNPKNGVKLTETPVTHKVDYSKPHTYVKVTSCNHIFEGWIIITK